MKRRYIIIIMLFVCMGIVAQDRTFTVGDITFKMKYVQGGTFNMGAQSTDPNGDNYDADASVIEEPVHSVTVSSFYMGEYVITQALWESLMYETPNAESENVWFEGCGLGADYPAYYITYNDVKNFITALNSFARYTNQLTEGEYFRMPTEAEWEFAARGGNNSMGYKYAGSNNVNDVAWYVQNSPESTQKVGQKQPNELGLYDMSGNVMEWCSDYYGAYSEEEQTNPIGASYGHYRVLRGGVYLRPATLCRITDRSYALENTRVTYYGARLVLQSNISTDIEASSALDTDLYTKDNYLYINNLPYNNSESTIIDLNGKVVLKQNVNESNTSINISTLPQGCYILNLNGKNYKFLKQ